MPKPYDYDSWVEMFLDGIRQRNPTGKTATGYAGVLGELGDWLATLPADALVRPTSDGQREVVVVPAAIYELAEITHHHLNAHIRYLQTREQLPGGHHGKSSRAGRKLSAASVSNHYRAISSFINWAFKDPYFADAGPSPMALVPSPKVPTKTADVISVEEIQAILATCGTGRKRPFLDVRDEAIIRLFCEAGPRRTEVATLPLDSIDITKKRLLFQADATKGLDARYLYFGNRTSQALVRYLALRARHPKVEFHPDALWLAPKGALTSGGLYQMICRRGEQIGIKVHPHQLRHTFANLYLAEGGTTENLKIIGGWHSDRAMAIYTRARAGERAAAEHAALRLGDRL